MEQTLPFMLFSSGHKKGDEGLVSSSTNMASAFSIIYSGSIPIPIGVNKGTWK